MSAPMATWLIEPLPPDVADSLQRLRDEPDVVRVSVMPDVHLARDVCVGVAVATRSVIYPAAIGGDIGCGVAALRFAGPADAVPPRADVILRLLREVAPITKHRRPQPLPVGLAALRGRGLTRALHRDGAVQLGTVGRGNHFLELQADADGALWAVVHTGSRALGPAIQRAHEASGTVRGRLVGIDADSDAGRSFLHDHDVAVAYAAASREQLLAAAAAVVQRVLGFDPVVASFVDNDHNHVRREDHGDGPVWVHRKGAIPAGEGQRGVIPGSMGTATYLVEGRGCPEALGSSSHGAGRCLSRAEARQRVSPAALRQQMGEVCFDVSRAEGLCEEAPAAYKDVERVMRAQRALTRAVGVHRPVLSHKGV